MNASQFMDKQILGLAASGATSSPPSVGRTGGGGGGELFDLMGPNPQEDVVDSHDLHAPRAHGGGGGESDGADEVVPSYDFQPIRTAPVEAAAASASMANAWGSLDSNDTSSNLKSAGIMEPHVLKKVNHEEERSNFNAVTVADIDRTMKKYADNLLHALEGVSSRLSQLEDRTHYLENSIGDLKLTIGNYNGSTDGKLRQFEHTLREVQSGVQILRDKQEIVDTQIQLTKLQVSKAEDVQSENAIPGQVDSRQQSTPSQPAVQPQHHAPLPSQPLALPALPAPNVPPLHLLQNQPPPQFPDRSQMQSVPPAPSVPTIPHESYYSPSAQPTEAAHQQYQAPTAPQPQVPPAAPQHYQPLPQYTPYSQPPPTGSVNPETAAPHSVPQQPQEAALQHYQLQPQYAPYSQPPPTGSVNPQTAAPHSVAQQPQETAPQHYQPPPQYAPYSQPPPTGSVNPQTAAPHSVAQQPQETAPQHYQPPPQYAPYSQPPPTGSVNPQTAAPHLVPQQTEESAPYGPPSHSYPPNVRPPSPYTQLPGGPVPPFYGPNPGMYEPPAARPNSGPPPSYNAGYKPQGAGNFPEPYGYSESPSHRGNAGMKSPSPFSSGGSGNYGNLPTAQILPQAVPVSSTPSASPGTRVAVDDVVDKVATMGFSKEQVRATVRRLTENGQNVDLNVVLDKLMNGTDVQPPQKGWFGR